jgi:hypothetical protein
MLATEAGPEEMMNKLFLALLLIATVAIFSACGSDGIASSSIMIYNAATDTLISTPTNTGHISIAVGGNYQIVVKRLVSNNGGTNTSEVTPVCTYVFPPAGLATANTLGQVHGVAAGDVRMEVKFQPGATDPIDRCYLDITVTP